MKKKIISFLLCATLLALVGCGNATEGTASSEDTTNSNTEATADAPEVQNTEINPVFCSVNALKAMFEEKGFLDYYKIYEEANNEAPKTDYNG